MYLALIFHEEEPWHGLISFRPEFKRAFKHIPIFKPMNHHHRAVQVLSVDVDLTAMLNLSHNDNQINILNQCPEKPMEAI